MFWFCHSRSKIYNFGRRISGLHNHESDVLEMIRQCYENGFIFPSPRAPNGRESEKQKFMVPFTLLGYVHRRRNRGL